VRGYNNVNVIGAIVTFAALPLLKAHQLVMPPFGKAQSAGADGLAHFNGVPEGSYRVCAQPPRVSATDFVDSSAWAPVPKLIYVKEGQSQTINISIPQAATLVVNVKDAGAFLRAEAFPGRHIALHVGANRSPRQPMILSASGPGFRTYTAKVPVETKNIFASCEFSFPVSISERSD